MADDKNKTPPNVVKVNRTELRFTREGARQLIIEHIRSLDLSGIPQDDSHIWIDFDDDDKANAINVRFSWD